MWISSTTLIQRANFATALLKSNTFGSVVSPSGRVEEIVELFLARDVEPNTLAELRNYSSDVRTLVQIVMQMPEYQLM